jgi:hypothetical protein
MYFDGRINNNFGDAILRHTQKDIVCLASLRLCPLR